jgi:serine phosphatase RsbU (regulator of sigma subunit)
LRVLLVEDDPADAFLVEEQLLEARAQIDLQTVPTMALALPRLTGVDCVLLDLRLPDANGLEALRQVLHEAAGVAVCVLTGLEDEHLGIAAVAAGAQDYLVKGQVDGIALTRAVRYAVERRRADENVRRLREAELRQAESARLERGLLPQPLVDPASAQVVSFYRPGRHRALLGGDFFDAIESPGRRIHLLVGDVCGHGADEAALGVELRVAWRALVLAGVPETTILQSLEQVLVSERRSDELFATVAMVNVDLDERVARVRLAGHPPPLLLLGPDRVVECDAVPGLVLGVQPGIPCPTVDVRLDGDDWALLLYTDGLIEGRSAPDADRLGVEGLRELLADPQRAAQSTQQIPAWLVGRAEERNGEPLADDVAMLLLAAGGAR